MIGTLFPGVSVGRLGLGRPGLALVVLSVVEQRLDAVRAVLAGAQVSEVAAGLGVHRTTVQRWVGRYLSDQIGGLADRSHRPRSCPHQAPDAVEVAVVEMRRQHPRWGSRRIRLELLRGPLPWTDPLIVVPSERTIDRILIRAGLVRQRKAKRPRASFKRFERPGPMQLWGIDIVGGVQLVNPVTGELREAKIITGVVDHSRFCVMAAVVERATGRAVCVAFAQALAKHGVPEEVITDNGKQFTDRFNRYGPTRGEVLFDKICRKNGVTHRLTAPASPNQNGKVERFHGTFRPEISEAGPFTSLADAQAAVDAWSSTTTTSVRTRAWTRRTRWCPPTASLPWLTRCLTRPGWSSGRHRPSRSPVRSPRLHPSRLHRSRLARLMLPWSSTRWWRRRGT